jgi:hypothetical protein
VVVLTFLGLMTQRLHFEYYALQHPVVRVRFFFQAPLFHGVLDSTSFANYSSTKDDKAVSTKKIEYILNEGWRYN